MGSKQNALASVYRSIQLNIPEKSKEVGVKPGTCVLRERSKTAPKKLWGGQVKEVWDSDHAERSKRHGHTGTCGPRIPYGEAIQFHPAQHRGWSHRLQMSADLKPKSEIGTFGEAFTANRERRQDWVHQKSNPGVSILRNPDRLEGVGECRAWDWTWTLSFMGAEFLQVS